ncbi:MAG TPA: transcription-repair coupling factor, partial [Candidatus Cloacimonadota bacterium]|nr:transcription-repair coupling factor [Candidatus Cloacimonadota bacterium]
MLYDKLCEFLNASAFFASLDSWAQNTQIYHSNQSASALIAAHIWSQTHKNIIMVAQDDIIAEDIWDDLVTLVGRDQAHYLPDYEILPYEERSPHYSIRATRMMTLNRAAKHTQDEPSPAIYCLSIRSLLRHIPSRESLQKHIVTLKRGEYHDPEELQQELQNLGYEIVYQVSKVYQASRRGGILDIFSPALNTPVRLEFWGDEIISMRTFSTSTQRSNPGEIGELTIVPARELCLGDIDSGSVIISKVREKGFFEGIENFYSLLTRDLSSFGDFF